MSSILLDKKIKITCDACGRISMYDKDEDPKTKRCGYCGHNFGIKVQSCIDNVPNASSETHIRYSWFCHECEHRGIKWVEKTSPFADCPNCNVHLPFHMIRQINPDKGVCKTIWESPETTMPTFSKPTPLKSGVCVSCNNTYSFRIMPPSRCDICGEYGNNFRTQSQDAPAPYPKPERKSNYIVRPEWDGSFIDCPACGFHHPTYPSPDACVDCGYIFNKTIKVQLEKTTKVRS